MLLTRSPLSAPKGLTFDLHALGTPLAFILSQDQTLRKGLFDSAYRSKSQIIGYKEPFVTATFQLLKCERIHILAIFFLLSRPVEKLVFSGLAAEDFDNFPQQRT